MGPEGNGAPGRSWGCAEDSRKWNRQGSAIVILPCPSLAVQCGCHLQPARRSPLPSPHGTPGLFCPLHPLQPEQEASTCPSGTLQGRKEPPPAWGNHRVLCGQVGIGCPWKRRAELGDSVIRYLTPNVDPRFFPPALRAVASHWPTI